MCESCRADSSTGRRSATEVRNVSTPVRRSAMASPKSFPGLDTAKASSTNTVIPQLMRVCAAAQSVVSTLSSGGMGSFHSGSVRATKMPKVIAPT